MLIVKESLLRLKGKFNDMATCYRSLLELSRVRV